MEYKANIMYANVGSDDAKVSISYFVTDTGSVESSEKIIEELNAIIEKHGGVPKEPKSTNGD